jgi:hypothetical protein
MWYFAVRAFVITSMVLNGAVAVALVTAMAVGRRPVSVLDLVACAGLLLGFLNAVGDLIEAEHPVIHTAPLETDRVESPAGPVLHIIRHRGGIDDPPESREQETVRLEGLEAFRSER